MKQMKMKKLFLFGAVAATVLTSCGEKDYYDPEVAKEIKDAERLSTYAASFKSVFGTIPADFCWDFTQNSMNATRAEGEDMKVEHIDGVDFGRLTYADGKTTVTNNKKLFKAIYEALPEGVVHEGKVAVLTAPANKFTIYPLSNQGEYSHDLYVKVNGLDPVLVYSKDWHKYDHPYVNGENYVGDTKQRETNMGGVTITAPAGTPIQIYITNIKTGNKPNEKLVYKTNPAIGTGTGSAILVDTNLTPGDLDLPKEILNEKSKLQFVGIEDAYDMTAQKPAKDWDYNDLVLLMVGNPDVPHEREVKDEYYYNTIEKRYMVEDLGATTASDIDFNDIVIDLVSYEKHHVKIVNGHVESDDIITNDKPQEATIRALGGTLDIALQFKGDGNTYRWQKSADPAYAVGTMYNTGWQGAAIDYDAKLWTKTFTLEENPWNPETNNVVVWVWPNETSQIAADYSDDKEGKLSPYQIVFPQNGEVPCMVAFHPYKKWRLERQGITKKESEAGTTEYWWE